MKFVNYFSSNARQWDKLAIEWRIGGITLLEIKGDISKKCLKIVVLNLGLRTSSTCPKCNC
tara:strand:- start:727 stop:909 length:183 start_codon:yes stop_codon:yes gene_type:complete